MLPASGVYPRENPRPTGSRAEVRVYQALREKLPAGWYAWHAQRVPGVPAGRQLLAQRLVDAHLRARAGRPRVLARIDARGGKHLWSLAGPGRFYIGPIWRVLEVSLHLLDLCEELPSRVASAWPGSA